MTYDSVEKIASVYEMALEKLAQFGHVPEHLRHLQDAPTGVMTDIGRRAAQKTPRRMGAGVIKNIRSAAKRSASGGGKAARLSGFLRQAA